MIKSSKRTLRNRRRIKVLDAACRRRVVENRDENSCQRCGAANGGWDSELDRRIVIQWAHVQSREYHILRWEDINSLALCDRCHVWFDNHKVLSYDWFAKHWPERWEMILRVLQGPAKTGEAFIRELYENLASEEKEI